MIVRIDAANKTGTRFLEIRDERRGIIRLSLTEAETLAAQLQYLARPSLKLPSVTADR